MVASQCLFQGSGQLQAVEILRLGLPHVSVWVARECSCFGPMYYSQPTSTVWAEATTQHHFIDMYADTGSAFGCKAHKVMSCTVAVALSVRPAELALVPERNVA